MIKIKNNSTRNLNILSKEHFKTIEPAILKKIKKYNAPKCVKDFLNNHLEEIICGFPGEPINISSWQYFQLRYENMIKHKAGYYKKEEAINFLRQVFNYDWFIRDEKKAYTLAKKLNVNTCPYCNRNYTVTVSKGEKNLVRPTFDHFLAKKDFPILALSFYNLIPSCSLCNSSLKGAKKTSIEGNIYPFKEGFDNTLLFTYFPLDVESAIGINKNIKVEYFLDAVDPKKAMRCKANAELFRLKEIYEISHADEIADIIKKFYVSGGRYLEILNKQFPQLGSVDELYKIAFASYFYEDDFEKRPLSKLTKDIFDQLKFTVLT